MVTKKRKSKKKKIEPVCGLCKNYYKSKLVFVGKHKRKKCSHNKNPVNYYSVACDNLDIDDYIWCKKKEYWIHIKVCLHKKCRCDIYKILIKFFNQNRKEK